MKSLILLLAFASSCLAVQLQHSSSTLLKSFGQNSAAGTANKNGETKKEGTFWLDPNGKNQNDNDNDGGGQLNLIPPDCVAKQLKLAKPPHAKLKQVRKLKGNRVLYTAEDVKGWQSNLVFDVLSETFRGVVKHEAVVRNGVTLVLEVEGQNSENWEETLNKINIHAGTTSKAMLSIPLNFKLPNPPRVDRQKFYVVAEIEQCHYQHMFDPVMRYFEFELSDAITVKQLWFCENSPSKNMRLLGSNIELGGECPDASGINPTCQPLGFQLQPHYEIPQMRFLWEPGCSEAHAFQISRTYSNHHGHKTTHMIGEDFEHMFEEPAPDDLCAVDITPEAQLVDDDANSLITFGTKQTYCINSLIKPKGNNKNVFASEKTCTSYIPEWRGHITSHIIEEDGNQPIEGVIVGGAYCEENTNGLCYGNKFLTRPAYNKHDKSTTQEFTSQLKEGEVLVFDVSSKNPDLVPNARVGYSCPAKGTANFNHLLATTPDFEIEFEGNAKDLGFNDSPPKLAGISGVLLQSRLVWFRKYPRCWFQLDENNNLLTTMTHKKREDADGFDRHFEIRAIPGWRWMAKNCRLACNLCSGKDCVNTKSDEICNNWAADKRNLCPIAGDELKTSVYFEGRNSRSVKERINQYGTIVQSDSNCFPGWSDSVNEFEYAFYDREGAMYYKVELNRRTELSDAFEKKTKARVQALHTAARAHDTEAKIKAHRDSLIATIQKEHQEFEENLLFPPSPTHWAAEGLRADVKLAAPTKVYGVKLRKLDGYPLVKSIKIIYKHAVTGAYVTVTPTRVESEEADTVYYKMTAKTATEVRIQPTSWELNPKPTKSSAWFSVEVLGEPGVKCCVGNTPVVWDPCMKMFTVCPSPAVITAGTAEEKATRAIEIVSWSASGIHDSERVASPLFRVRGTSAKVSLTYPQLWEMEIFNVFGGSLEQYSSGRTADDGTVKLEFSSLAHKRDLIRPVRIMPFLTSELHSSVLVNFEHSFRSLDKSRSAFKTLISTPTLRQFRPANPFNAGLKECSLSEETFKKLAAKGLTLHKTPKLVKGTKSSFRWAGMEHADAVNREEYSGVQVDTANGVCYLNPTNELLLVGPSAEDLQDPVMMFEAVNEIMPKLPAGSATSKSMEPGNALIADETIVSIEVRLGYHGTEGFCPVNGILFCAYYLDEDKRPMVVPTQQVLDSCATTDENGLALVKVPFGSHVGIVYGCQTKDQNEDCVEEEAEKGAPNFDSKNGRFIRLALGHTDILLGAMPEQQVEFQDVTKHPVYVLTGAGPYLPLKSDTDDQNMLFEEQRCFYALKEIASHLFVHPTKPECSLDPKLPMQFKTTKDNRLQIYRVPHDITMEYKVQLLAEKHAILPLNPFFDGKMMPITRAKQLPSLDKPRVVVFEYRVVPDISLELKDEVGQLKEQLQCKDDHFDFVVAQVVKDKPNKLEITASILEKFSAALLLEGEKECELPFGDLKFSDAVAASANARTVRKTNTGGYASCSLAGCLGPITQDETAKEGVRNAKYKISAIAPPERGAPWVKVLAAKFEPRPGSTAISTLRYARILVTGEVPLTAHQTINLPEYIPLLILRDPPGSDSTAHWSKHSEVELQVSFAIQSADGHSVAIGGGVGVEVEIEASTGLDLPFGGPFVEFDLPPFTMERSVGLGHESVFGKEKVVSLGNTVMLSASSSYETSDYNGNVGTSADLFVTPSLSLKILTSLVVSVGDLQKCQVASDEVTRWNLLEGSAKDTVDSVLARNVPNIADSYISKVALTNDEVKARSSATEIANQAMNDKEWNSVSQHSVFDVLNIRLPQLQKLCVELVRVIDRCGPEQKYTMLDVTGVSASTQVFGAKIGLEGAKEKDVKELMHVKVPKRSSLVEACGDIPNEPISERVCQVYRISNANKPVSLAGLLLRLKATHSSILGWRQAIYLNEHLKALARENHPMDPKEMLASPLLVGQQKLNTGASSVVGDSDFDIGSGLQEKVEKGIEDGFSTASKSNAKASAVDISEKDIEAGSRFSKASNIVDGGADASVISFTGSSSAFTYEVESSSSHGIAITLVTSNEGVTSLDNGFGIEFGATFNLDIGSTHGGSSSKESTHENTESTGSTFGFTLKDNMLGNMYDVKVSRDPIYGTPVFHTLGGRSACSHSAFTDVRDNHKIRFATNLSLQNKGEGQIPESALDGQSGEDIRDVAVQYHKDTKPCASTFIVIEDLDPYHGGWEYYFRLDDVNGRGLAGIGTLFNGEDFQGRFVIGPYAPGKTVQRVDFCPTDEFDIERSGGVYHNIDLIIESACESDMANNEGLAKFWSETVDDPAPVCDTYVSNACRTSIFEAGEYRIVDEQMLHNKVTIRCLSFVGPEACKQTATSRVQLESKSNLRGA